MFKSLDSIASVVGIFMYLTISKFKQVLRSRKDLGKVLTTTLLTLKYEPGLTPYNTLTETHRFFSELHNSREIITWSYRTSTDSLHREICTLLYLATMSVVTMPTMLLMSWQ